ncbi:beta-lactamase family protein [bacterium]|nr:beta-lactamase family protein [bacterium]
MQSPEPFSGVLSIADANGTILELCRGDAIRSESIPNRIDTRFQMASGCKIFTGLAICQLIEEGKLTFETRLSECVDADFPNFSPDITLHHLLTHTSGITSYFEEDVNPSYEAIWQDYPAYRVRRPADFLPLFQNKPMKFPPGERFDYNDAGFILLGLAVEKAAGIPFAQYIQKNIFDRSGMEDSGYFALDCLPKGTASAYIPNGDGTWRTNIFAVPAVGAPDGGAFTAAPDMQRFWRALVSGELLGPKMTERMLHPHVQADSPTTHYGYGVWLDRSGGQTRRLFVVGSDPGVALRSEYWIEEGLVVTMLGNTGEALWHLYPRIENALGL